MITLWAEEGACDQLTTAAVMAAVEKARLLQLKLIPRKFDLTIIFNLSLCLSGNSSQKIGPKRLKFSGFDGGHPGVVIRK